MCSVDLQQFGGVGGEIPVVQKKLWSKCLAQCLVQSGNLVKSFWGPNVCVEALLCIVLVFGGVRALGEGSGLEEVLRVGPYKKGCQSSLYLFYVHTQ